MQTLTRREFAAAALAAPISPVKEAVRSKAEPFPPGRVRLGNGPFQTAAEANRRFLADLEPERLLHTFRLTAGLPSSAEPLGGWETPDVELRGHFLGHYLSACALTGDGALGAKASGIVAELARCQKAIGNGYLSAFPEEFFDRLRDGKRVWAPWYTLHKIMAGLLDVHTLCGDRQAMAVLGGMVDWTRRWFANSPADAWVRRVLLVEFGGMNELLYNLYARTGRPEHRQLAEIFDHRRIFDPLAERRDELKGLHANTNIPKIIGAARRYELTGESRYRNIAMFFWDQVTRHRCYSTGGTSNFEHWRTDPGKLAAELSAETQECCCTYNMLKLTRHLFAWTAEARYADYYERALFNGVLGTLNPEDGMTMYFVPLASGYWKMFGQPRHSFWCCTGTGAESFAKLTDSIYFHDEQGVWVNLFIASEAEWREKGVRLVQETNFPEQEGTAITVDAARPVEFALRVRVPWWATRGGSVKINGKTLETFASPSSYVTIVRTWKKGDRVEVSLPMSVHAEPMPDDEALQSFLYGPLVLAGRLGKEGLTRELLYADRSSRGSQKLRGKPVAAPELREAIRPGDGPLEFRAGDVRLAPLYRIFGERYAVYWRMARS